MAEEDLFEARRRKLDGISNAWPARFVRTHLAAQIHDEFANLQAGEDSGKQASVAGRLVASRVQGKVGFGDLQDSSGKIQLFVTSSGIEAFDNLDSGDIVGASGEVIRTKRGELSVRTDEPLLLAKALRAPPDKWHGVSDTEVRYRQRYLDLIANPEARRIARARIDTLASIRRFLDGRGFQEVETPTLHPIFGGGYAQPFVTHYNAIDRDMFLRVATELYLKRLIVGGMDRVYEVGRVFRNEGVDWKHSPEATMLETYEAYADYLDVMDFVQAMVRDAATDAIGTTKVSFRDADFDLADDWRRVTMHELVSEVTGETVTAETDLDTLKALAGRHHLKVEPWWGPGMIVGEIYDKVAEGTLKAPTIVYDYPKEISPLAKDHRDDPRLVERFEAVVCGMELCNAFSELNDPIEQRKRFEGQQELREHGDMEANPIDEAFLEALEYGMPPTGGLGVGLDRLVMVLTGANTIREVILFPALRSETTDSG